MGAPTGALRRAAALRRPRVAASSGRPDAAASSYTAGSLTHPDMRRWLPYPGSADADLNLELGTIRSRSRDLARNHGVAEGAGQTYVDNIVGTGFTLKSRPHWKYLKRAGVSLLDTDDKAEEWSNNVESLWCAHAESTWFDAGRQLNFHAQTAQIQRSGFYNGEALALPLWLPEPGAAAATRFLLVESDRLGNPNYQPDRVGLRGGIETDEYGAPQAYYIYDRHPGDRFTLGGFTLKYTRVPAYTDWGRARVLHVHDKERTGQSRGKPGLASVLRQFKVLGDYSNAELKAAVVNAMVALVTESSLTQEGLVELLGNNPQALANYQTGLADRKRAGIDFNAGMVIPLQLGEKIAGFTPARPNDSFEPFVLAVFKQIAAGLNIPYELLLKDFSQTNYSSARAALLEGWRFFKGRRAWLINGWAQPAFELWFEEKVGTGEIEAPNFYELRYYYTRAKWIGDGRGWVDPLKEAQAAEVRMRNGITTLEDECAEQGQDWEETMAARARIEKRAKSLNVQFPWMAGATQVVETVTKQEDENGDEIDNGTSPPSAPAKPAPKKRAPAADAPLVIEQLHVHAPITMAEGSVQLEATIENHVA